MRNSLTALVVLVLGVALGACATVSKTPGNYSVSGMTTDTIGAMDVASRSYVEEYNAETYRRCVESGTCYGYPGGGYHNDYWLYYRDVYPAPVYQPMVPGTVDVPNGRLDQMQEQIDDNTKAHFKHHEYHRRQRRK
jgi:hypothetical protein